MDTPKKITRVLIITSKVSVSANLHKDVVLAGTVKCHAIGRSLILGITRYQDTPCIHIDQPYYHTYIPCANMAEVNKGIQLLHDVLNSDKKEAVVNTTVE